MKKKVKKDRRLLKSIISLIVILALFFLLSWLVQKHMWFFQDYLDFGFPSMIVFTLIVALSIILAPVSSIPLFPIASNLWGWLTASVLGVFGWTLGAAIAFLLARKYGVDLVKRIIPITEIQRFEDKIPDKNIFLTLVFFRMVTPIDGISYLFGLFSRMKLETYILATMIGLIPLTMMISYLGTIPAYYTMIFLPLSLIILTIGVIIAYRKMK